MAFIKLQFKPGVNRDQTDYSGEGGWFACNKIRYRSGYPEKMGGWVKATTNTFIGVCRQMWNWITTYGDNLMGLGTNSKLYLEVGGYYYDITPLRATNPTLSSPNTNNCVYTSNGSSTVTIVLGTAHDAETGSFVDITGVSGAVGGIPVDALDGSHEITTINTTAFSFVASNVATSTVSGGGGTSIVVAFELAPGNAITAQGYGWCAGTWGRTSWGLGAPTSGINLPQTDWWLDNFDNDMVANVRNGGGYIWERGTTVNPGAALGTRAISLGDYATASGFSSAAVPVKIMQLLVSQQDKHLIAFGAVPFGSVNPDDFDPMLIRWADQDTPGDWTPTDTNTAGDIRVSRGSEIVRALPTRQEILVWTNSHLYTLQFLGTTDVFALQEYADNISIMSPRAVASAANVTYWMGQDKFYAYTGRVETLPCTIRDHIFNNINLSQAAQVVCGTNEQWNEVWWFYPTSGSDYNDAYAIYNHLERIWYYGTIERTAWLDTPLRHFPQAANTSVNTATSTVTTGSGYAYNHEYGVDDDGAPMESYIQSNVFDLDDGEQLMLTRRIIPDISFSGSTAEQPQVTMEIKASNFPGTPLNTDGEDMRTITETSVGQYTNQVFLRARARQMALKIVSEDLGVQWQLGAPRLDARQDGRQ